MEFTVEMHLKRFGDIWVSNNPTFWSELVWRSSKFWDTVSCVFQMKSLVISELEKQAYFFDKQSFFFQQLKCITRITPSARQTNGIISYDNAWGHDTHFDCYYAYCVYFWTFSPSLRFLSSSLARSYNTNFAFKSLCFPLCTQNIIVLSDDNIIWSLVYWKNSTVKMFTLKMVI